MEKTPKAQQCQYDLYARFHASCNSTCKHKHLDTSIKGTWLYKARLFWFPDTLYFSNTFKVMFSFYSSWTLCFSDVIERGDKMGTKKIRIKVFFSFQKMKKNSSRSFCHINWLYLPPTRITKYLHTPRAPFW